MAAETPSELGDWPRPVPPRAVEQPKESRWHGHALVDPYAWMRDDDWQAVMREPERLDPEIRRHLEAENAYSDAMLAPLSDLRRRLVAEMRGRIKEADQSIALPDGDYAYYRRFREGGQHPIFCRRPTRSDEAGGQAEEILLDGDREAEGKPYFRVGALRHSPSHRVLGAAIDALGSEGYSLFFRHPDGSLATPEEIPETSGSFAWTADGGSVFYVRVDANRRPSKVFRHVLGTPTEADTLVYEESDPGFFVTLSPSESRRYILVEAHDHETSEAHLIDVWAPQEPLRPVAPRKPGEEYHVHHDLDRERFLILTNADGAEDFKVMEAPLANPGRENWQELLAHEPGRLILALELLADWMVRLERVDGLPRIVVRSLTTEREETLGFQEAAYALSLVPGFEYRSDELRFGYSSLSTPERTFLQDLRSGARTLLKEQEVPSGHDPAAYSVRRLFAEAADGERVPISLIHRRDLEPGPETPCLLYGYGAYGMSIPAGFSPNRLSLVERGFVYAIAHVRGGTERGYRWYTEGKREKKPNTFEDFIACARHLVAAGLTGEGRIVAHGGSAGGLLMGAVANRAPELFGAILAEVPFVDTLNTMLDAELPLTPPEWPEWGNPIDDARAFETILSYSPYDNVARLAYPAVLATAGLTDPRVTYWEPAKWVARLRVSSTSEAPILLHTNLDAGHGGAAGRFERLDEVARLYAFAVQALGLVQRGTETSG